MKKNCLIILNYNDFETTNKLIKSVLNYKILDKIIVVDNCSTDDSIKRLGEIEDLKVEIILAKENKGYATGNNIGIKYAIENFDASNIIVANPDIYIDELTLGELILKLNENDDLGIVTATMKELKNGEYLESEMRGWKKPSYKYCLMNSMPILSKFANNLIKYDKSSYENDYLDVFAVQGSFFIVKAEAIKKVGYMEEGTFLYFEESILGHKLEKTKYKIRIYNNLFYLHDHSVSIDKNIKKKVNKFKILNDSQEVYIRKYLEVGKVKIAFYKIFSDVGIFIRKVLYTSVLFTKK